MLIQANALRKPLATSFCNIQNMLCMTPKTLCDTKAHDMKNYKITEAVHFPLRNSTKQRNRNIREHVHKERGAFFFRLALTEAKHCFLQSKEQARAECQAASQSCGILQE